MQHNHDQVSGNKCEEAAHRREMPHAREMKTTEQKCQPRELDGFVQDDPSEQRQRAERYGGGVSQLLQRVVLTRRRGLGTKEKIVPRHRPHAWDVMEREQHRTVMPADDLIHDINYAARGEEPHEGEMPLQRAAEPSAERERLRYVEQNLFWNLRAEAGERTENPQSAGHQHE